METTATKNQDFLEWEAQLEKATDQHTRIDLLHKIAWAIHLNDTEKGSRFAEQARDLSASGEFEQNPYLPGIIGSLRTLIALNTDAGNYDLALSQSLQALEILESISDKASDISHLEMDILGVASWTYRCLGDYVVAAEYAMKKQKLSQAMGNKRHEASALNVLSVIYAESHDLAAALEMGQRVVQYCHEGNNVRGESIALNNLAMTYLELGNGKQALEACQACLQLARSNGIEAVALTALSTMGEIYLGIKDFAKAEEYLQQALTLAREKKAGSDELQCLLNLGQVYLHQHNNEAALATLQDALLLSRTSNAPRGEFQCHQLLSEAHEKQGDLGAALHHFKQFHTLKETVFNEDTAKRLSGLQVVHQVETAKRDAQIHYLTTIELKREIEERKSAQALLQKLVSLDPLTGMLNRRELFTLGEQAIECALQQEQPLTLLLFDIDHFKELNDSYGHASGDQMLIRTTKLVRESLQQDAIIGRYGGDEFVILLPRSNCNEGQQIAVSLCEKIASQVVYVDKNNLCITVSLGIAELRQVHDLTMEALIACADHALYVAKQAGRNQLAVYSGCS